MSIPWMRTLNRKIGRLIWLMPGRWPNLLELVKKHRTIFLTWATLAPARYAERAAASPEAPLPITSTSTDTGAAMGPGVYHCFLNRRH